MATRDERQRRIKRRDQLALLAKVMSDPEGREYFYDLLSSLHVYSSSFATNALAMAFREGERNVGLRIGADLTEASPEMYLQMLKEAGNVRQRRDDNDSDERDNDASGEHGERNEPE